jgi:hypothetical protein
VPHGVPPAEDPPLTGFQALQTNPAPTITMQETSDGTAGIGNWPGTIGPPPADISCVTEPCSDELREGGRGNCHAVVAPASSPQPTGHARPDRRGSKASTRPFHGRS